MVCKERVNNSPHWVAWHAYKLATVHLRIRKYVSNGRAFLDSNKDMTGDEIDVGEHHDWRTCYRSDYRKRLWRNDETQTMTIVTKASIARLKWAVSSREQGALAFIICTCLKQNVTSRERRLSTCNLWPDASNRRGEDLLLCLLNDPTPKSMIPSPNSPTSLCWLRWPEPGISAVMMSIAIVSQNDTQ